MCRRRFFLSGFLLCCLLVTSSAAADFPAELPADLFDQLQYRHVGPQGNRVSAVAGVPGKRHVYYVGAASGGIFKTVDGGIAWEAIFDDQPVASIGSLAVAPSDPNVVWAGTGETFIRSNVSIGNGIYKSTDAGKTWSHMGLEETGRIGRVVVHPTDSDIVFAAALGHCYGPQQERGVYRSLDGGVNWEQVLFVDENTGAADLVVDPNNPRILFAGMWQMQIWTWGRQSGGPGSGIYMSRDGGDTWKRLEGSGLPEPPLGKVGLTISAADSSRVYALIETNSNRDFAKLTDFQGTLWRSDDGGDVWTMINADHSLMQRPLYYTRALAAPDNANEIHFMSVEHIKSLDGGVTVFEDNSGQDHHDIWIDPRIPDRMIVGHDFGVSISTNRGKSWLKPQLPIAQMYHVEVDDQIPYFVYGNRQDGLAVRGPSNTLAYGSIPAGAWQYVGGCEVGFTVPKPDEPDLVWAGCFDGLLEIYDHRTGHLRNVSVWPEAIEAWPASELEYRFHWNFPIAISPHDPRRVYVGSQYVHRTVNEGQTWTVISPDLTTDDEERQRRSGGLTLDDAGPTVVPTLFAIAESPLEEGLIWAGTNDGQVQLTRDGGESWSNVTAAIPELPPWGTVSNVEPSRHAAGTCYITVDLHQENDPAPYVYKTADYGRSWQRISNGIAESPHSYAHCVREDPVRPGMLYLGTENALYISFDDGNHWHELQTNLPHAPVHWLTIQERFDDLVVATYGRGIWILDDITPLRRLDSALLAQPAALLPPRPAYRFHYREGVMRQPQDPSAGENPPYGARIHYYLKSAPADGVEVELAVLDPQGEVVRTLEDVPATAGLNRTIWNLDYDPTDEAKLRTPPDEHPHVRIPEQGWRPQNDGGRMYLQAPPGTYTVRLNVGEKSFKEELVVMKDPGSAGGEDDIRAQMEVLLELRDLINASVGLINEVEWLRKQLRDLADRLEDLGGAEEILDAGKELEDELRQIEDQFFDLRFTEASSDGLKWKRKLYAQLTYLAWAIGHADFRPTDAQIEVHQKLKQQVLDQQQRFRELRKVEIAEFNQLLDEAGYAGLIER